MTHDELAEAHRYAIRIHYVGLADAGGDPPPALLGALADVAEEHAVNRLAAEHLSDAAIEAWIRDHPDAFAEWIKVNAKPAPRRRTRT